VIQQDIGKEVSEAYQQLLETLRMSHPHVHDTIVYHAKLLQEAALTFNIPLAATRLRDFLNDLSYAISCGSTEHQA